jgi:hypothetical protein
MHSSRLGDEKLVKGRYVREYVSKTVEEEVEEIRARIAQNNKARVAATEREDV